MNNNCFRYGDNYFKQIRGTAMGSPFAPAYANIFMAHFQKTYISSEFDSKIFWLKRYIDDIFMIVPLDFNSEDFLNHLNSCRPTIKFTMSLPDISVPFLDLLISLTLDGISTDLYSKPTDSHKYLRPSSSHPKHIFRAIVYAGATRLRRICSDESIFSKRLAEFSKHLILSGYKSSFIEPIFQQVTKKDRKDLLILKNKSSSSNRVPFVTTFHPQMPKIKEFHKKHQDIIFKSDRMSNIFPDPPIIALKRPRNLGDILIKTKFHLKLNEKVFYKGFERCGQVRCQMCSSGVKFGTYSSTIKSSKTGKVYNINSNLNCNSSNCIYVISCTKCHKQYVGKTVTPLRHRFNNHRKDIRNNDKSIAVAFHFNLPGHCGERDVRIQAIELVPYNINIEKRESSWMWNLSCHNVNGGINLDEPYFEKLCLSN